MTFIKYLKGDPHENVENQGYLIQGRPLAIQRSLSDLA